ncbi:MAG: hypothetical protein IIZ78_22805 [Clostridiales bacterium]|nr:hypothetical protein [Clostridiales bacterium]
MSDNMKIYEAVRSCPANALKPIQAGRLKGKSDINPMWRIKMLTEQFGVAGIGWYYDIVKQWTETGANGEVAAFVNINLYVKIGDEWSKPIQGNGGSMLVTQERNGLYTDDEAFKKALTDAISVSCKALGFAADVYWNQDSTKYSGNNAAQNAASKPTDAPERIVCKKCGSAIQGGKNAQGVFRTPAEIAQNTGCMCVKCYKESQK